MIRTALLTMMSFVVIACSCVTYPPGQTVQGDGRPGTMPYADVTRHGVRIMAYHSTEDEDIVIVEVPNTQLATKGKLEGVSVRYYDQLQCVMSARLAPCDADTNMTAFAITVHPKLLDRIRVRIEYFSSTAFAAETYDELPILSP